MRKRSVLFILVILIAGRLQAQQFGLFNTHTLFDVFENPSQRTFVSDQDRRYASNFFIPTIGVNASHRGDGSYALQHKFNEGVLETGNIPTGQKARNRLYGSANAYLLTFRINSFYRDNRELGFSWQVHSDLYANYTNETLVALRNYVRFVGSFDDLFNGDGYGQSYHQFSAVYRVNYTDELAFGIKLGVLSGITYNKAKTTGSSLNRSPSSLAVGLTGSYKASFLETEELHARNLVPDFKNPGLAMSLGTTYQTASGVTIIGNIKDLGFIRWNKKSVSAELNNETIALDPGSGGNSKQLQRKLVSLITDKNQHEAFYSATNAKVDFFISKTFNFYTPNLMISKNLFYNGADVALVNNFKLSNLTLSLTPAFNMNQFLLIGAQALYQTTDLEFFIGTDNLLKSSSFLKTDAYQHNGVIGASAYMGVGIKFGAMRDRL